MRVRVTYVNYTADTEYKSERLFSCLRVIRFKFTNKKKKKPSEQNAIRVIDRRTGNIFVVSRFTARKPSLAKTHVPRDERFAVIIYHRGGGGGLLNFSLHVCSGYVRRSQPF